MLRKILLPMFVAVMGLACEKTEETGHEAIKYDSWNETPLIVIGRECGFCAGSDSLIIDESHYFYAYDKGCNGVDLTSLGRTNAQKWNDLMNSLEVEEFTVIDLNSCDICADGCDTWIKVKTDKTEHTIRYGHNDEDNIQPIKPFVDHLEAWISEFRTN